MPSNRLGYVPLVLSLTALGGCFLPISGDGGGTHSCDTNADCAGLAHPNDPCSTYACIVNTCERVDHVGTATCECKVDSDCYPTDDTACFKTTCQANQCVGAVVPAGPAPSQASGDCKSVSCDGETKNPIVAPDPTDAPMPVVGDCKSTKCVGAIVEEDTDLTDIPPPNECSTGSCTVTGPFQTPLSDGTSCSNGFCFDGECMTGCTPQNPTSCGGEGNDEPTNNSGTSAESFSSSTCGMLDQSDVDWYTFYADDQDFVTNVLHFSAWSSAPTIELCAYVSCVDGSSPGGGCSNLLPGPNGSQGCCWTGASQGFFQSWDLDCATNDDSGTVYVSIQSQGGSACDTYAVDMSY